MEKISKVIKSNITMFITITVAIMLASILFTTTSLRYRLTSELVVNWFIGFIASTFVYITWVHEGRAKAYTQDKLINAKNNYVTTVYCILKYRLINKMPDFCKRKTEANLENARLLILQKKGYYAKENVSFNDIDLSTLTVSQQKTYKKLITYKKVIKILPNQLYCNSDAISLYNANDYSKSMIATSMVIRLISSILITGMMAVIVFDGTIFNIAKLVQMLIYMCILISCIYLGFATGYKSVVNHEVDAYVRKTRLNESFLIENDCELVLPGGTK